MNSQKKIEVNQSSLLSLKAELLRKKQEVHDAKLSECTNKPSVVNKVKLKTKFEKANDGVNERNKKDAEEIEEEGDLLRKSQKILESKSKLYDELLKNRNKGVDCNNFLVDFKNKEHNDGNEKIVEDESDDDKIESDFDDCDDEWVDFVDCLGRTKRCHRDDLDSMKANDEKLRLSLFGEKATREPDRPSWESQEQRPTGETGLPELCSEDMRRELLRKKWEEEERELSDRKDIHYQHVLFDEARNHGVGYYSFSTDELERHRQMEELKNLRKETLQQQAAAQDAAKRKKKQTEERLKAARRRKRERLGLPLDEDEEEAIGEEEKSPVKVEELKREVQNPSTIRPWDIGKEKTNRILTQEEWIERRREERPEEFAPPQMEKTPPRKKKKRPPSEERSLPEAYLEDMRGGPRTQNVSVPEDNERVDEGRKRGVEIPPPPTFELYGPGMVKPQQPRCQSDIEKSIEEGLNFIRKQVEEKQAQQAKGFLDFV